MSVWNATCYACSNVYRYLEWAGPDDVVQKMGSTVASSGNASCTRTLPKLLLCAD